MTGPSDTLPAFSTASLAPPRRLPYWRDVVCDTFVELECEAATDGDFYGSLSNRLLGDIQFSEIHAAAQQVRRTRGRISTSKHDVFLVSMQIEGRGQVRQDGRTAVLEPGDFCLYDTTRPYALDFKDSFCQLVLRLPRQLVLGRLADAEQATALPVIGQRGTGRLAFAFLRHLHSQVDQIDPLSLPRLHSSAVDLLATALAEQNGIDQAREPQILLRRRIGAFIDQNLADPRLNCAMIARAQGISERYLRKLFEGRSASVSEWIWSRRLDQARQDLIDPLKAHLSITAIGFDVGFKDAAHFSRAFKAHYGETPRDWRARSQSDHPVIASEAKQSRGER